MPIDTVATFVKTLQGSGVLEPAQLPELSTLATRFTDPKILARELLQRGWLTPFQINQLFQGRDKELVLDQYVLLEKLGEGGMGQVFKARHRRLDRIDALKIIRKDHLSNANAVLRFHQEAKAAARVSHANIVSVYDASESNGTHFLAMEYVEGIDLGKLVKQGGPLPIAQACAYVRQAALGLQHAHERGLVHRDIKPSNLFVNMREGVVKVLDMGMARLMNAAQSEASTEGLTQTGAFMGTLDYISPEQAKNSHLVDIRADIYSLGCSLYYLLTGQPPFPGGTMTEKLLRHQLDEPTPVEQLRPEVTPALGQVVRRLMAKRFEERYATPAEVADALEPLALSDSTQITALPKRSTGLVTATLVGAETRAAGRAALVARLLARAATMFLTALKRRPRLVGGGVGALAILLIVLFLFTGGGPPLDRLEHARIPAAESLSWVPPEVVSVLGEHRWQHWGVVKCVAFSPDGKTVASGSYDRFIHLWDAATGQVRATLKHSGPVSALAFSEDGKTLLSGSSGEVKVWDTGSGTEKATIRSGNFVGDVAYAANGRTVAWVTGRALRVWDLASEKSVTNVALADSPHASLAFSPDGAQIAVGFSDTAIRLWDVRAARITATFRGHAGVVTALAYSPDGNTLASCSYDKTVKLWEVETGKPLATLEGHTAEVYSVAFAPDGKTVASGGYDRTIRLWDSVRREPKATLRGHLAEVQSVAFAPDSRTLVSGSGDRLVKFWDLASGQEKPRPKIHAGRTTCLAFAPDGRTLVSGGDDHIVKFWDLASKKRWPSVKAHTAGIAAVAFSADGKQLASASYDYAIRLWDAATGQVEESLVGHRYAPGAVAFAPDGRSLLSASAYELKLWDVASARERTALKRLADKTDKSDSIAPVVAYAPNGATIASARPGDGGGDVLLWDPGAAKERAILKGHKNQVTCLAFTADSQTLASGTTFYNAQSDVRLWTVSTGKERATLEHRGGVSGVAFAPSGRYLATAGLDGRIIIWNPANAQKIQEWQLPGSIQGVAFAPDSRHLASANADGTIYIFRLNPETAKASK